MITKADLARNVMQQGTLIAAGEEMSAVDLQVIADSYDAKLAEWRRRGFVWWENTVGSTTIEEIPLDVAPSLALLLFNEVKSTFGVPNDAVQQTQMEEELLKRLRRLNHKPPSGESTPFSSY